tara:strand:+ start:181 stop:654 length:474 start_codon:yes stop_codon:yes gene_type:complete
MRLEEDNTNDENTYFIERDTKGVLLTGKVSIHSLIELLQRMQSEAADMVKLEKELSEKISDSHLLNSQLGATLCMRKKTKATDLSNDEMVWDIGHGGYTWSYGQQTFRRLNKFKRRTETYDLKKHIRIYVHITDEAKDDGLWVNKTIQHFNQEKGED